MKYLVFLLIILSGCSGYFRPEIPSDILAELQTDKRTMFNMASDIGWRLSESLDKHTEHLKTGDTLLIYIHSNGGDVNAAENIINTMSRYKTICVADVAISAAFEIFQSCTVRVYTDNTVLMTHHHSIIFGYGQVTVPEVFLAGLDGYIQETYLLKKCAARMKMSYSDFLQKIEKNNGEWYMNGPREIRKANAADYHIKESQFKVKK